MSEVRRFAAIPSKMATALQRLATHGNALVTTKKKERCTSACGGPDRPTLRLSESGEIAPFGYMLPSFSLDYKTSKLIDGSKKSSFDVFPSILPKTEQVSILN
jgi:hypothetical protein